MRTIFLTIPALAKILSGGSFIRRISLTIQFWFFFLSRKFFKFDHDFSIGCTFKTVTFPIFLRYPMDIAVLREIYVDREYEWFPANDPKVIIDLGAHFGDTALYYHAQYPEATIISVEPSPENFERLKKNTAGIQQIVPVQAAVGGMDGSIQLNLGESSLGYSVKAREGTVTSVEVPQVTLRTLFAQNGIQKADLIKFDIEGGEEALFVTDNPSEFADAYIGEVHEDLISIDSQEFVSRFSDFNIEKIRLTNPRRFTLKATIKSK
jgi:FkbM family methyltransferase